MYIIEHVGVGIEYMRIFEAERAKSSYNHTNTYNAEYIYIQISIRLALFSSIWAYLYT